MSSVSTCLRDPRGFRLVEGKYVKAINTSVGGWAYGHRISPESGYFEVGVCENKATPDVLVWVRDYNLEFAKDPTAAEKPIEVEEAVCAQIRSRRDAGRAKYKTTMERTDLTPLQWLQHAQEEALDLAIYLEKLRRELLKKV